MAFVEISEIQGQPRPPISTDERRVTGRAQSLWSSARNGGEIPSLADLRPADGDDFEEHFFLLKADPNPRLAVFIICGDGVHSDPLKDPLGGTLWEALPERIRTRLCQSCASAIMSGAPVYDEGTQGTPAEGEIRYRSVFMPVRSGNRFDSDYVFGAFSFKENGA